MLCEVFVEAECKVSTIKITVISDVSVFLSRKLQQNACAFFFLSIIMLDRSAIAEVMKSMFALYVYAGTGAMFYKTGLIESGTTKVLAKLAFFYFAPCLSFISVSSLVDAHKLGILWKLLILPPIHILVGFVVAFLILSCFKLPPYYKKLLTITIACCNSGDIPVAIINVLAAGDVLTDPNNPNEKPSDRVDRGIGYVQLYVVPWNILMWTVIWPYLQVPNDVRAAQLQESSPSPEAQAEEELVGMDQPLTIVVDDDEPLDGQASCGVSGDGTPKRTHSTSRTGPLPPFSLTLPAITSSAATKQHGDTDMSSWKTILKKSVLTIVTSPVLMASVLGIVVGVTPMKQGLFDTTGSGERPPLSFVVQTLRTIGSGYIPTIWLMVGSKIGRSFIERSKFQAQNSKLLIGVVVFTRLIVAPLTNTFLVYGLQVAGMFEPNKDPLFLFVSMCTAISPSASTLLLMIELMSAPFSGEIAFIVMLQYIVSLVSLPLIMSAVLGVVKMCA